MQSETLRKTGEAIRTGLLSLVLPKKDTEPQKTIAESRGEFIEEIYPQLFGNEEMGDVSREVAPPEITAVIVAYEQKLARDGLLKKAQAEE